MLIFIIYLYNLKKRVFKVQILIGIFNDNFLNVIFYREIRLEIFRRLVQ